METTFATRDMTAVYRDRTLTAVFEREDEAERAIAALRAAGFGDARIRLASGGKSQEGTPGPESFWERLTDFFMPKEDEDLYAESLRRGLHLLTVTGIPVEGESLAISILDAEGAVDLEGHAHAWRADDGPVSESVDYAPGGTAGMTGTESEPVTSEVGHEPGGTAGMTGYADPEAPLRQGRRPAQRDTRLVGARVRAYDW